METINFGQEENNSAPKAPRNKKLIWSGVILAVLILSVIGWQYWQYIHSPYYQQMQGVKYLERIAKESDKWGGKTPEETVVLFRDAVKKGDFDLASKYGDPKLIKPELEKMKTDGKIEQLIKDLENGKIEITPGFDGYAADFIVKENNQQIHIFGLFKSEGGIWKIVEF